VPQAEIRVDCHGIGGQGAVLSEPRIGVGLCGRVDVAPLRIGDDDEPAAVASAMSRSSSAMPAEPWRSKKATCG